MTVAPAATASDQRSSAFALFLIFLRLGVTSFGGPIAHLGYFREEFVARRKWLDERAYADLVALCQFLPGPASSQVGMAVGLSRAGYAGALAAWTAFTLPSAIALVLFAYGVAAIGSAAGSAWLHGLKIAAVAVVAQAVLGMMRSAIDEYKRYSDLGFIPIDLGTDGYPKDLEVLVEGVEIVGQVDKKVKFMRRIPVDPMTGEAEWGLRSYQDRFDATSWGGENVYDVYSQSRGVGLNGVPYQKW